MLSQKKSSTYCQRCYDHCLVARQVHKLGWCLLGRTFDSLAVLHCFLLLLGQDHGAEFSQYFQSCSLTSLYCTTHVPTPLGGCLCACPMNPVNHRKSISHILNIKLYVAAFVIFSFGVIISTVLTELLKLYSSTTLFLMTKCLNCNTEYRKI